MNLYESIKANDLKEYEFRITLTNDAGITLSPTNIVTTEDDGTAGCHKYLEKLVSNCTSAQELAKKLNDNRFPNHGDRRIFGDWKAVSTKRDVIQKICTRPLLNSPWVTMKYDRVLTVDSYDDHRNHSILRVWIGGTRIDNEEEK